MENIHNQENQEKELRQIQLCIHYIERALKINNNFKKGQLDEDIYIDAISCNIAQIGEVINKWKKINPNIEKSHPEIEWKKIYGMRTHLVHEYHNADITIIKKVIEMDIPKLKEQLIDIGLKEFNVNLEKKFEEYQKSNKLLKEKKEKRENKKGFSR